MRVSVLALCLGTCAMILGNAACDTAEPPDQQNSSMVTISLALGAQTHDVAGFLFQLECTGGYDRDTYVKLHDDPAPIAGGGAHHYYADLFAFLPPGECEVKATPKQNRVIPSDWCDPVTDKFMVLPGKTTQIILWSQCRREDDGVGILTAGLNEPPVIENLVVNPGLIVDECETVRLRALATDPEGDALTYSWSVGEHSELAAFTFSTDSRDASLEAQTPGEYTLVLDVEDDRGGLSSQEFIVTVLDDPALEMCQVVELECCVLPLTIYRELPEQECILRDGEVIDKFPCIEEHNPLCCLGSMQYHLAMSMFCEHEGWTAVSDLYCEPVCCLFDGELEPEWRRSGNCDLELGEILGFEDC